MCALKGTTEREVGQELKADRGEANNERGKKRDKAEKRRGERSTLYSQW